MHVSGCISLHWSYLNLVLVIEGGVCHSNHGDNLIGWLGSHAEAALQWAGEGASHSAPMTPLECHLGGAANKATKCTQTADQGFLAAAIRDIHSVLLPKKTGKKGASARTSKH